jgi:hypothetical protein
MCKLTQLFTVEQLAKLNATQIEILREAQLDEVRTNEEIYRLIKERLQKVYDSFDV